MYVSLQNSMVILVQKCMYPYKNCMVILVQKFVYPYKTVWSYWYRNVCILTKTVWSYWYRNFCILTKQYGHIDTEICVSLQNSIVILVQKFVYPDKTVWSYWYKSLCILTKQYGHIGTEICVSLQISMVILVQKFVYPDKTVLSYWYRNFVNLRINTKQQSISVQKLENQNMEICFGLNNCLPSPIYIRSLKLCGNSMMGSCGGCARVLLIFFNIIFWLSGLAILGVGIWFLVDKNIGSYTNVINIDSRDQYFKYAAYILIAFGGFVFLVGFCGCCGAVRGSKCLLGFYIFFLVIVFGGELAAGILMAVYKGEIESKLDDTLKKSIKNKYSDSSVITSAWDIVQIKLQCCGGVTPTDYQDSYFTNSTSKMIPVSCCVLNNREQALENPAKASAVNQTECQNMTNNYYKKGCKDGLKDWASLHSDIIIGVGIGIACLEIIGLVVAICYCCQINREEKY
ncbi:hypothetical protein ACJMK2_020492 [Sinanodonta woodiana]|uniref:Tetraspanin n=1 Tax=Sinanodonta woodiana TaxID=1069815 RepID=A0ABD3U0N1_SINWO